jgi:signal transduction histidine kinase/ActR/RegA family two-component response regulator
MSQATAARSISGWKASSDRVEDQDSIGTEVQPGRILLLLSPSGEASLVERVLHQAGLDFHLCADASELLKELQEGAAAVLLTQEMLDQSAMRGLVGVLGRQSSWSDVPFLFLSSGGTESIQASQRMLAMLEPLGHVIVLERPLRIITLLSALQSALQSRRRQYEVRDLLGRLHDEVRHRDEFLMLLAHEVRNPLGAIRNSLQVLDQVGSQANLAIEQRSVIGRQTGILSSLIDDVLEVFQVTSGRVALQKQAVDLTELVGRCLHGLQATVAQRHSLILTVASGPLVVHGDPVRLCQAFGQMVMNAVKNSPPGSRIAVALEAGDGEAVLRVKDSGLGLRPDQLPHVFDLFPPPDRFPEQWQGGLSIALPIVRSIVGMHGGQVQARSPGPGKGSELEVRLPLRPGVVPAEPVAPVPAPASGPPRRILIIEDNPDGRETLRLLLQLWHHKVEVAVDGKEGVAKALAGHPDVALVDIGLPEMDGYQVASQLRQALGKTIRLIAMTGYGQFHDSRRAREAGFDHHFIKPVDPDELQQLLAESEKVTR